MHYCRCASCGGAGRFGFSFLSCVGLFRRFRLFVLHRCLWDVYPTTSVQHGASCVLWGPRCGGAVRCISQRVGRLLRPGRLFPRPPRARHSRSIRRPATRLLQVLLIHVFLVLLPPVLLVRILHIIYSPPYHPHVWIVRYGCEVQTAPGNGLLYLAVAWLRCLTRTWQPIISRWLMGARLYQLSARASDAGRRARPRLHHYPEPVSSDGAAGYTMRGDPGWPPMKTVLEQGMATDGAQSS